MWIGFRAVSRTEQADGTRQGREKFSARSLRLDAGELHDPRPFFRVVRDHGGISVGV